MTRKASLDYQLPGPPYKGPMEDRSDGTQYKRLYGAWMPAHYCLGD